jgi:hypothetical protein
VLRGREAGKARFRAFREAFPDIAATLHEVVAQDDLVAARYTLADTHRVARGLRLSYPGGSSG